MREVETEADNDVLRLLREEVMRMEDPHEMPEVVLLVAKVAVYEPGSDVHAIIDPGQRVQGQLHRVPLRDNMPGSCHRRAY